MNFDPKDYEKHYSEQSFWEKLSKHAAKAGKKVVYTALLGYYALDNPKVSPWAKARIYGALGYLVFPVDLVPDIIPAAGYTDDLAVLMFAIGQIALNIDKSVRHNALQKLEDWFGNVTENNKEIIDIEAEMSEVEKATKETETEEMKK
ncbi:YkvA family protein [Brevibacillus sp. 179-C9.3 HS]|uniref:YkvA family protein n=1 Tax=unclassified Brevibacillus TaxID=2684853 RepID=UPI0039A39614